MQSILVNPIITQLLPIHKHYVIIFFFPGSGINSTWEEVRKEGRMFRQIVCVVLATLAVTSHAFVPPTPLVKASCSSAARVIQSEKVETGTYVCTWQCGCLVLVGRWSGQKSTCTRENGLVSIDLTEYIKNASSTYVLSISIELLQ